MVAEVAVQNAMRQAGRAGTVFQPGMEERFETVVMQQVRDLITGTSSAHMPPLVDLVTQVYSDSANLCIALGHATFFALRRLRGNVDDAEASRMLAQLRADSSGSC